MSTDNSRPDARRDPALSFGGVADAYDRGRPAYPREVAAWLTGRQPLRVLELGAGTGKLTADLVELGHDVHATDPDAEMLAVLSRALPDVRVSQSTAEEIPAGDASYDVVVSAQAFHWFDLDRALPEISRVTRPRGRLALVWNQRDERIPWVRRLGGIIGTQKQLRNPSESLDRSGLFDEVETERFAFWQNIDRATIQDLVLSRSNVATLGDGGRAAKLAEALALYDDYGRGMDGMQLPYVTLCFRTTTLDRLTPNLTGSGLVASAQGGSPGSPDRQPDRDAGSQIQIGSADAGSDGSSTDMLLIDFH